MQRWIGYGGINRSERFDGVRISDDSGEGMTQRWARYETIVNCFQELEECFWEKRLQLESGYEDGGSVGTGKRNSAPFSEHTRVSAAGGGGSREGSSGFSREISRSGRRWRQIRKREVDATGFLLTQTRSMSWPPLYGYTRMRLRNKSRDRCKKLR